MCPAAVFIFAAKYIKIQAADRENARGRPPCFYALILNWRGDMLGSIVFMLLFPLENALEQDLEFRLLPLAVGAVVALVF